MLKYNMYTDEGEARSEPDIFRAAELDDAVLLLECLNLGQSLNTKHPDYASMTPIHYACFLKRESFLKAALAQDFDPWIPDENDRLAIDIAMANGLKDVQQAILEKMYPEFRGVDYSDWSPNT